MILLLDIGNTNTHVGLANDRRVVRHWDLPTEKWLDGGAVRSLKRVLGKRVLTGAALCSVVPRAVGPARRAVRTLGAGEPLVLSPSTVSGVGIDYPKPATIGPDRLANAVAVVFSSLMARFNCFAMAVTCSAVFA